MFELRDLECFLAIADHGTFSRAAEALRLSQPSLSRRIAALERQLGVSLFSRARRQISLTPAGRTLAREARGIFAEARMAVDVTRAASRGVAGHLRIAYRSAFRYRILPGAMRMMAETHPDAALTATGGALSDVLDQVRARALDVALMTAPSGPDDLVVDVLREAPIVVALPDGHRCTRRKIVALEELANEPFVSIGERDVPGYDDLVRAMCAEAGFTPRVVVHVDSADLLVACVAARIGVALIDGPNDIPVSGATYRPTRPAGPTIRYLAIHRAGNDNPILPPFLRFLHRAAA